MHFTTASPHILYVQPNKQLEGVGLDFTITRYTEDFEERARSMQHFLIPLVRKKDNLCTLLLTSVVQPHRTKIVVLCQVHSNKKKTHTQF